MKHLTPELFKFNISQIYEINNTGDARSPGGPFAVLFDDDTVNQPSQGFGKMLPVSQFWFNLMNYTANGIKIYSIDLYGYQGTGNAWNLSTLSNGVITNRIAYTGVYKNSIHYDFSKNPIVAEDILIESGTTDSNRSFWPTKMVVTATWTDKNIKKYPQVSSPFENYLGVNDFAWDLQVSGNADTNIPAAIQSFGSSLGGQRLYHNWQYFENTQGLNLPQRSHNGGWNLQKLLTDSKNLGLFTLVDILEQPDWMLKTWPTALQNNENKPIVYGADSTKPEGYKEHARMGFQFAAFFGSTEVPANLLTVENWETNKPVTGLNIATHIEDENEPDRTWKGLNSYETPYEQAARLSAFYDGHKNSMGTGTGVKNADPNMLVVMGGLVSNVADPIRGIVAWSKTNRGYRPDGSVDVPFDVINYHTYVGENPDTSSIGSTADIMLEVAAELNVPVFITETGYDTNQGSPIKAPVIGSKSADQVRADWILRSMIIYSRKKIQRVFIYQDYDLSPNSGGQFDSSGIFNLSATDGKTATTRYFTQVKQLLSGYKWSSSSSAHPGINIDVYKNASGSVIKTFYLPTATGASLNINTAKNIGIYTLDPNGSSAIESSGTSITVTETPLLVKFS